MAALRAATQELDPAWRAAGDAARRITADHGRIARILAAHPHPNPADRDPKARANAYTARISEGIRTRRAAADAAQEQAVAAVQGRSRFTRILAAVGIFTPAHHEAVRLAQHAMVLADAVEGSVSKDDFKHAQATGEAHAYAAQRTTMDWEARPDVMGAMENARLNAMVEQAISAGDPSIRGAVEAGDPDGARAIIRAREQEVARQAAEQARLADLARGPPGHDGARPPTPGRR